MKTKCQGTKKNGAPCNAWATTNGYCRKHVDQAVSDDQEILTAEEVIESPATESAIETVIPQEEESAPKKRGKNKHKRKPKICGALTIKGTPCTFKVSVKGRCKKHQGAPDAPPEAFIDSSALPEEKGKSVQITPGSYINSLIDREEVAVFEEYYQLLRNDFNLNDSSDRMNCEVACLYYLKLLRALKTGDTKSVSRLDQLLRDKLQDLKAHKK